MPAEWNSRCMVALSEAHRSLSRPSMTSRPLSTARACRAMNSGEDPEARSNRTAKSRSPERKSSRTRPASAGGMRRVVRPRDPGRSGDEADEIPVVFPVMGDGQVVSRHRLEGPAARNARSTAILAENGGPVNRTGRARSSDLLEEVGRAPRGAGPVLSHGSDQDVRTEDRGGVAEPVLVRGVTRPQALDFAPVVRRRPRPW